MAALWARGFASTVPCTLSRLTASLRRPRSIRLTAVGSVSCEAGPVLGGSHSQATHEKATLVVDLRSDVLTKPTAAMRKAMATATAGDDVFNEDPTVHELQRVMAEMFNMEAALYVPSGTMGNLIAVMCHCWERGAEVVLGSLSHLTMYEQGGVAQIGNVHPRHIPNLPDGTFELEKLQDYIRLVDDPHYPRTALIGVENTHNHCGGRVIPIDFLKELKHKANEFGVPVHMDGARVLNAVTALDVQPADVLQYVDSVSVCLSKGVGAPVGSVIGGSAQLIKRAVRLRKVLGGGWRQPGPCAAAALVALEDYKARLQKDHQHARLLAQGIMNKAQGVVDIDLEGLHTNIVMINILKPGLCAQEFCDRLHQVTAEEAGAVGECIQIKSMPWDKYTVRFCLYMDVTSQLVDMAMKKLSYILDEYASD